MEKNIMGPMEGVRDLLEQQMILSDKLMKSLTIQDIEPRAFEFGPCKLQVVGNIQYRADEAKMLVKLANGEVLEHPLFAFPMRLWPTSVVQEYTRADDRLRKRWNRSVQQ